MHSALFVHNIREIKLRKIKMNITGAIFDFDGTLFDSMHVWHGIRYRFLESIGITFTEKDEEVFKGLYLRETLLLAKDYFDLPFTMNELFDKFFTLIEELYMIDAEPKNDIIPFLQKLKANGVKTAIATASGTPAVIAALKKYNMEQYFDAVYSTYDVEAAKTEPKVYRVTHAALNTPKESTWIFEDALYAAKTAKADGFNVVAIYDKSEPNQSELKATADKYIVNYSELPLFE